MDKQIKTVLDANGTPVLELVKQSDVVVIYEADDMDRQLSIPVSLIPALIRHLEDWK